MTNLNPDAILILQAEISQPEYLGLSAGAITNQLNSLSEDVVEDQPIAVQEVIKSLLVDGTLTSLIQSVNPSDRALISALNLLKEEVINPSQLESLIGGLTSAKQAELRQLKNRVSKRSAAQRLLNHEVTQAMVEEALVGS